MTNRPRTRIERLAQSLGQSPVPTPNPRSRRMASARRSLTRAFDDGEMVALYSADGQPAALYADPTVANDLDPTRPAPILAAVPETSAAPAAAAPAATDPVGFRVAGAEAPGAEAPVALRAATAPGADRGADETQVHDGFAAAPAARTGEVAGWTVRPAADANDQAFAEDIQAILAHVQSVSPTGRVPLPDVPPTEPVPPPPAVAHGVGAGATHDIFDQMAAANAPSRFDQGPVSLSVDFDRLDRALEDVPAPAPSTPRPPAASSADPIAPTAVVGQAPTPESAPPVIATPPVIGAPPAVAAPTQPPEAQPPEAPPAASEPAPVDPSLVKPADASVPIPAGAPFRVVTDVPLLPQGPGLSCHAAACASLVAWRDEVTSDSAAVAAGAGYWERYADGRTAAYPDVLEVFSLANASIGKPPAAAVLRDLLDNTGPLFVTSSPPGEHAVVVAGITGDGTANGTVLDVVDPWAQGMTTYSAPNPGSRYSVPYSALLEAIGSGPEHEIVVAHLRRGLS